MDRAEDNTAADGGRRKVIAGCAPPRDLTVADRLSADGAAVAGGRVGGHDPPCLSLGRAAGLPAGWCPRIVILREDLQAWAFSDEHLVTGPPAQLRPATDAPAVISHHAVRQRARREATAGSVERLREIERSG
jgi:hypothetical protein